MMKMRRHRWLVILSAAVLLMPFSLRSVQADTSSLELYIPKDAGEKPGNAEGEDNDKQASLSGGSDTVGKSENDAASAPVTFDETGDVFAPALIAVIAGASASGAAVLIKRQKPKMTGGQ